MEFGVIKKKKDISYFLSSKSFILISSLFMSLENLLTTFFKPPTFTSYKFIT